MVRQFRKVVTAQKIVPTNQSRPRVKSHFESDRQPYPTVYAAKTSIPAE